MLALALLLGCPNTNLVTDGGTLTIETAGLSAHPLDGLGAESPFLADTSFTMVSMCAGDCQVAMSDCYDLTVTGPGTIAGSVARLQTAGDVELQFEPKTCAAADQGYTPVADTLGFIVVDASTVTARLVQWPEEQALTGLVEVSDGTPVADLLNPPGAPFRVLAGSEVRFPIAFSHPDHAGSVAFETADLTFEIETTAGTAATVVSGDEVSETGAIAGNYAAVTVGGDTEATLFARIGGQRFELARFVGVPESTDFTAAIAVGYVAGAAPELRTPLGARAVVRDDQGLVYGVPFAWSTDDERVPVWPEEQLPGLDYTSVNDLCTPPSENFGLRELTLTATWGDVTASAPVTWTARTEPGSDEGWSQDFRCEDFDFGCGCDNTNASAVPMVLLVGLSLVRRRRRA